MRNYIKIAVISVSLYVPSSNLFAVEFNTSFLQVNSDTKDVKIDVSRFEKGSASEGKYLSTIYLNDRKLNKESLISLLLDKEVVTVCLPADLIHTFELNLDVIKKIQYWNNNQCVVMSSIDKNATLKFDEEKQALYISIPQALFLYDDPNWVPAEQRENGINGVFLDYDTNYSHYKPQNGSASDYLGVFGTVGANLSAWRARGDFQYNTSKTKGSETDSQFDWTQIYLFRDLASMSAKVLIGETYSTSSIFENIRFLGVALYSDENMMPSLLRGYAPDVSGIADTNATVTVSQDGRILKQTQVAAGPFRIQDINQYVSGMLDVKVEEANGKVSEFKVYSNTVPFLTRYKQFRYKFNAGKIKPLIMNGLPNRQFIHVEGSYGLMGNTSIYGGLVAVINNNEYKAYNFGVGQNIGVFGAISADITHTVAKLGQQQIDNKGNSYRFNYAKQFESTGTQFNFVGYRFSDENYTSLSRYVDSFSSDNHNQNREKNLLSISLSQYVAAIDTNFSISGTRQTYWTGEKNNSYSFFISNKIKNGPMKDLTVSLNATRYDNKYENTGRNRKENTYSLSFSYPLGKTDNIAFNASYDDYTNRFSPRTEIYGNNDIGTRNYNLGVQTNDGIKEPSIYGHVNQKMGFGEAKLSGTYGESYQQISAGLSGSLTATAYGAAAHQRVYQNNSRLFIDTELTPDVVFDESGLIRSNRFGAAVKSNVNTYQMQEARVNDNLSAINVAIDNPIIQTVLNDGAIGYRKIETVQGDQILVSIKLADGNTPPFGSTIINSGTSRESGIVSENGNAYITGIKGDTNLVVDWGSQSCKFSMSKGLYDLSKVNSVICR